MLSFNDASTEYVNNISYLCLGKISYETEYGIITFLNENNKDIVIFEIYILPEYRNSGKCKNLLSFIIDELTRKKIKRLHIVTVISKVLYNFLDRWIYKNKKWSKNKMGFTYRCF